MELIKLWCEKIYWYKVKPIYVVKKTKSNWLKSDLLRKHLTSSHSYPLITKSDFGKIPLTHSSYIHKLTYMCFVQELSLNTAKRPLHTQPKRHTFETPFLHKFDLPCQPKRSGFSAHIDCIHLMAQPPSIPLYWRTL